MKNFGLLLLGFASLALVLVSAKPTQAQGITGPYSTNYNVTSVNPYTERTLNDYMMTYYPNYWANYGSYFDMFNSMYFQKQVMYRNLSVGLVLPPNNSLVEEVVLLDRDTNETLVLNNQNTGPFSMNRIVLRLADTDFRQLISNVSMSQDVSVGVDTGSNTVSFNTLAGGLTTGDVSINIQ